MNGMETDKMEILPVNADSSVQCRRLAHTISDRPIQVTVSTPDDTSPPPAPHQDRLPIPEHNTYKVDPSNKRVW